MATISAAFGKLFSRAGSMELPFLSGVERNDAVNLDPETRLRTFANEDVYFHVKHIDNTRVVRDADPAQREACWKWIGSVAAAAVLLIAVLMPSVYGLLAGYRIQQLKDQQAVLLEEKGQIEMAEAELLSPARMQELAKEQKFVDPAPDRVVYLNGHRDHEFAAVAKPAHADSAQKPNSR